MFDNDYQSNSNIYTHTDTLWLSKGVANQSMFSMDLQMEVGLFSIFILIVTQGLKYASPAHRNHFFDKNTGTYEGLHILFVHLIK